MSFKQSIIAAMVGAIYITYPVPTNNLIALFGDSRTANGTENANSALTPRLTSQGYGSWVQIGSNFRGKLVANYGINTDTIDGLITRLHAAGISGGTAPADPRRGFALDYDPGLSAGTFIVLIGVNNTVENISVTGPKYDTLFKALIDAGKVIVICNEIPNTDQSGQGAVHLIRRQYLETWPNSSTGMTSGEKTTYGAKVVRVNTYDAIATSPTSYNPKTGYYQDLLHPNAVGSRYLGETIGAVIDTYLSKNGYPARNVLATNVSQSLHAKSMFSGSTTITATNGEAAGAGGSNLDGNGGVGISGTMPANWVITRSSSLRTALNAAQPTTGNQLTITSLKTTDSDGYDAWQIRVVGQMAGTALHGVSITSDSFFASLANTNAGNGMADGDSIYTVGRVKLNDGHLGVVGLGTQIRVSSPTYPDTGEVILSGGISASGINFNGMATGFDKAIISQPRVIPTGMVAAVETKTISSDFTLTFASGIPIDFTVTISRFAMLKNI